MTSIVACALWYGVVKSARKQANADRLQAFFAGPIDVLAVDDKDARAAGEIRATLEPDGTPIGAYDLFIAGQTLRRGATLVTANVSEFVRVAGLTWEDWAAPT